MICSNFSQLYPKWFLTQVWIISPKTSEHNDVLFFYVLPFNLSGVDWQWFCFCSFWGYAGREAECLAQSNEHVFTCRFLCWWKKPIESCPNWSITPTFSGVYASQVISRSSVGVLPSTAWDGSTEASSVIGSLWRFPKDDEWTEQDDAGDSMFAIIQL